MDGVGIARPGERKSVEPMAARIEPARVRAAHQSLHHFVAQADWSDEALLAAVRAQVLPVMEQAAPIRGWMVDDTGLPKKGSHSVGVARQYCGQLGKQDNCQVAVTLSLASDHASLPIAHRLSLPQPWAEDAARRAKAGVPDGLPFQTKPQIALAQIQAAVSAGVAPARCSPMLDMASTPLSEDGITELGLADAVGVQSHTSIWPPGTEPLPPKLWSGRGRPPSLIRRRDGHAPVSAKELAMSPPKRSWRRVTWREGSNATLASRFAAVRVRPAHRDYNRLAVDRGAQWRRRAHQILALDFAAEPLEACARRSGQAALADRTRLPGPRAGAWSRRRRPRF
jgi:SRSO17 transposase